MRVKFRAECVKDVLQVVHVLSATERASIEVSMLQPGNEPEITIDLGTTDIEELRRTMCAVEDGHVMVETLKAETEYDGERDGEPNSIWLSIADRIPPLRDDIRVRGADDAPGPNGYLPEHLRAHAGEEPGLRTAMRNLQDALPSTRKVDPEKP